MGIENNHISMTGVSTARKAAGSTAPATLMPTRGCPGTDAKSDVGGLNAVLGSNAGGKRLLLPEVGCSRAAGARRTSGPTSACAVSDDFRFLRGAFLQRCPKVRLDCVGSWPRFTGLSAKLHHGIVTPGDGVTDRAQLDFQNLSILQH